MPHIIINIYQSKFYQVHRHWEKGFLQLLYIWRFASCFFSDSLKKLVCLVCMSLLCISREEKTKPILSVGSKFIFLHVDSLMYLSVNLSWKKKKKFKMLVVFLLIFVADKNNFWLQFHNCFNIEENIHFYQRFNTQSLFCICSNIKHNICHNKLLLIFQ